LNNASPWSRGKSKLGAGKSGHKDGHRETHVGGEETKEGQGRGDEEGTKKIGGKNSVPNFEQRCISMSRENYQKLWEN